MSKQLFEFVKVAAGEPFPFEIDIIHNWNHKPVLEGMQQSFVSGNRIFEEDRYFLRPAESPDAGREELETLRQWKADAMYVMEGIDLQEIGKEIGVKLGSSIGPQILPWIRHMKATRLLSIAERERFIQKVSYYPEQQKTSREMLVDFMRSHWPTPADPGSQVEAGKFAEWATENGWNWLAAHSKWEKNNRKPNEYKNKFVYLTTADLIALYQQSLNEKK